MIPLAEYLFQNQIQTVRNNAFWGFKETFPYDRVDSYLNRCNSQDRIDMGKLIFTELKESRNCWFLNPFGSNQRKHDDENIEKLLYKNTFTKYHSFMTFRSRFSQEILLILLNMILNRNIRKLIIYYRIYQKNHDSWQKYHRNQAFVIKHNIWQFIKTF